MVKNKMTNYLIKPWIEPQEDIIKIVESMPDRVPETEKTNSRKPEEQKPKSSIIIPNEEFWTIENVSYNGKIQNYALSKKLLPSATQDIHAQNRINNSNNGFYCGDMPLNYAIFKAVYNSSESKEKQEIRQFIKKNMRERYLTTLTRIQYQSSGLDKIIHNYGIPNEQFEKSALIVGSDRELIQDDSSALEALVLTKDVKEVKEVLNWINETPVYIWRLNNKPKQIDERIAWFYAISDGAGLGCSRNPSGTGGSLGYAPLGANKA